MIGRRSAKRTSRGVDLQSALQAGREPAPPEIGRSQSRSFLHEPVISGLQSITASLLVQVSGALPGFSFFRNLELRLVVTSRYSLFEFECHPPAGRALAGDDLFGGLRF